MPGKKKLCASGRDVVRRRSLLPLWLVLLLLPTTPAAGTDARLVEGTNAFGFSLFYDRAVNQVFENVLLSPASVAMALAMTWNGANRTTADEMEAVLGLTGMAREKVNQSYEQWLAETMSQKRHGDPSLELALANSLWARKGTVFMPGFEEACRRSYRAEVQQLDFHDPESRRTINNWAEAATQGRIREIIAELSPNDRLLLINAVYFKAAWQARFDSALTQEEDFHGPDSVIRVKMMRQTGRFRYLRSEGFSAVVMPYGTGRFSAFVLLPDDSVGLLQFCDYLNTQNWESWVAGFADAEGEVILPRFRLEYEEVLNEALTHLGMEAAFDPAQADFSAMFDGDSGLCLSEVKHKAFLEVNEEGSEAAAATSVRVTESVPEQFRMKADRPFLFFIRDNRSGILLFLAAVYEPQ